MSLQGAPGPPRRPARRSRLSRCWNTSSTTLNASRHGGTSSNVTPLVLSSVRWLAGRQQTKMTRSVNEESGLTLDELIVEAVPDGVAQVQPGSMRTRGPSPSLT